MVEYKLAQHETSVPKILFSEIKEQKCQGHPDILKIA